MSHSTDPDKRIYLRISPIEREDPIQRNKRIQSLYHHFLICTQQNKDSFELVFKDEKDLRGWILPDENPLAILQSLSREKESLTLEDFKEIVSHKEQQLWELFCHVDVGKDNGIHLHDLQSSLQNAGTLFADLD